MNLMVSRKNNPKYTLKKYKCIDGIERVYYYKCPLYPQKKKLLGESCCICFEKMKSINGISIGPCKIHGFHKKCIKNNNNEKCKIYKCPICRKWGHFSNFYYSPPPSPQYEIQYPMTGPLRRIN